MHFLCFAQIKLNYYVELQHYPTCDDDPVLIGKGTILRVQPFTIQEVSFIVGEPKLIPGSSSVELRFLAVTNTL